MWKYNKGEWSEAYVFLKLLGDGELFAADAKLEKISGLYYPIVKIIRDEGKIEYVRKDDFVTVTRSGTEIAKKPVSEFETKALELLQKINSETDTTFESNDTENFMKSIGCDEVKSDSSSKRDITLMLHDIETGIETKVGFSIKSRLGSPSTLLNAGRSTNFTFEVAGNTDPHEIELINEIDSHSKIKDRICQMKSKGMDLEFVEMQSRSFQSNLQLVDGDLPRIVAFILLYYYSGEATSMTDLVSLLQKKNPCEYDMNGNRPYYGYKIKHLLTDMALGMVPESIWNGQFDASGGYIVVKENGDVVCYHIYNYNEFQDYILQNTKLETASSSKHDFGVIKVDGRRVTLDLNLQIRFLK